jgi:ketosteroid isomerase-like protein
LSDNHVYYAHEVEQLGLQQLAGISSNRQMSGKYMVLWHRTGDDWQLFRDMWNEGPDTPK